jgi:hypothetical protein
MRIVQIVLNAVCGGIVLEIYGAYLTSRELWLPSMLIWAIPYGLSWFLLIGKNFNTYNHKRFLKASCVPIFALILSVFGIWSLGVSFVFLWLTGAGVLLDICAYGVSNCYRRGSSP